jgi:hypothetical protein
LESEEIEDVTVDRFTLLDRTFDRTAGGPREEEEGGRGEGEGRKTEGKKEYSVR